MASRSQSNLRIIVPGVVIALSCLGTTILSRIIEQPWLCELRTVLVFLAMQCAALAAYIVALRFVAFNRINVSIMVIVGFAVLFRLVALIGEPLFDDDIYRYVWDGKVTANGFNPYKYSPSDVTTPPFDAMQDPSGTETMEELDKLNELWFETPEETTLFGRINYPNVRTIYPPVTQGVFAFAHLITPTPALALTAFKFVLTCLDVLAIFFIVLALKKIGLNPCLCIIYAWHPLVIKEIAGTGHMESIPVFLIALGVYLLVCSKRVLSAGAFTLGVCSKLVPVLALPFVGVELYRSGKMRILLGAFVVLLVTALCYLPFADAGKLLFSGTGAFADEWVMNAGPFELLRWIVATVSPQGVDTYFIARVVVVILLAAVVVITFVRGAKTRRERVGQIFTVLAAIYILSPVQNPWYLCWSLPLLCFNFRWSWIALSVCAVLYYVYFGVVMNSFAAEYKVVGTIILIAQYIPFVFFLVLENKGKFALADDKNRKI